MRNILPDLTSPSSHGIMELCVLEIAVGRGWWLAGIGSISVELLPGVCRYAGNVRLAPVPVPCHYPRKAILAEDEDGRW
jgi:hypothetical protein